MSIAAATRTTDSSTVTTGRPVDPTPKPAPRGPAPASAITVVLNNPMLDLAKVALDQATRQRDIAVGAETAWFDANSHFRPNMGDRIAMVAGGGAAATAIPIALVAALNPLVAAWVLPVFGAIALVGLVAFLIGLFDSKKVDPGAVEPNDIAANAGAARSAYDRADAEYQRILRESTTTIQLPKQEQSRGRPIDPTPAPPPPNRH